MRITLKSAFPSAFLSTFLFLAQAHSQWVQTSGPRFSAGDPDATIALTASPKETGGVDLFASTMYHGVFRSTDNGASWTNASTGLGSHMIYAFGVSPNRTGGMDIFAGSYGDGLFRSTDNGVSWALSGLTSPYVTALASFPDETGAYRIFAGASGMFRSTDGGNNWDSVSNGLTISGFYSIVCSGTNLYAGGWGGVFRSTNNGASWTIVNNGLGNLPLVQSLAVFDNKVFVGMAGAGIFVSTDSAASWTLVPNGLTNAVVRCLLVVGNRLYVSTGAGGVFFLSDDGSRWIAANRGLTETQVDALVASETELYAATPSGVWQRPLAEFVMALGEATNELPASFELEQNYPNPFNPSTRIKYTFGGTGDGGRGATRVRLVVYDLLGREVAVLVNEPKAPGSYEMGFDGTGLSSGVYICRLTSGAFMQSRTMMLLR
jgi:photosystem II stability/assembly factor-like uncharacterized protein